MKYETLNCISNIHVYVLLAYRRKKNFLQVVHGMKFKTKSGISIPPPAIVKQDGMSTQTNIPYLYLLAFLSYAEYSNFVPPEILVMTTFLLLSSTAHVQLRCLGALNTFPQSKNIVHASAMYCINELEILIISYS